MFYLDGLDELEEAILSKKEIVDVAYSEEINGPDQLAVDLLFVVCFIGCRMVHSKI